MPRLSRWFIRAALIYLLLGAISGSLMLLYKSGIASFPAGKLLPIHMEMLLSGWVVQLAMGVAFWILPRLEKGASRGWEAPAWTAFILVNAGIVAVAAGSAVPDGNGIVLAGRLLETTAVVAFAVHAWPRIATLDRLLEVKQDR